MVANLQTPDEVANSTGAIDFAEEAYKISNMVQLTYDWDPGRIVYYLDADLFEFGQTYRIVFTVKADTATELRLRIGSTLWVDPWIDNFTGGLKTLNITDEYTTYEFIFTADKAIPNGSAKFQFMYGYLATDAGNAIYIKDFMLEALVPTGVADEILIDDFTYVDEDAFEAEWTYRSSGANTSPSPDMTLDAENDLMTFTLPASANEGWILARKYDSLTSLGVTDDYPILAMYVTNNTNVTSAGLWLYWSGSQNAYTVTLPAIGESGWVFVDVYNASGKLPSEITDFGLGFNNWSSSPITGSFSISYVTCVKDSAELHKIIAPVYVVEEPNTVVVDDFTYVDEDAFEAEWTERANGVNTSPSDIINVDLDHDAFVFDFPATATNGWLIARRYESLTNLGGTNDHKVLAFYMTNNTNVTSASIWLYWSGNQNAFTITLPAIGESGWVIIPLSVSGKTTSEIIDFGLGFNNWSANQVTGSFMIYEMVLVEDQMDLLDIEIEVPFSFSVVDDFTYADETAFEAEWTERSGGTNINPSSLMNLDDYKDALVLTLPASAQEGWNLVRKYDALSSFGALQNEHYLSFYVLNNTNVTEAKVWLYWDGNQNAYTVTLPAIGEYGWVTIDVYASSHLVSQITDFAFGFNNWSSSQITGSISIFKIVVSNDPARLGEVPLEIAMYSESLDDFTYADEAAFEAEWTYRSSGTNHATHDNLTLNPEKDSFTFTLPTTANEGWVLARKFDSLASLGGTDQTPILAFYLTNNTNVTTAGVWLYWSGSQNVYTVNLPAIGETGWVFVDVRNSGHSVSEITDFGLGFNNWSSSPITGSYTVYEVVLVEVSGQLDDYEVVIPAIEVLVDDFTYADEAAFEAEYTERTNGVNTSPSDLITLDTVNESFTFTLPATAPNGWNLVRKYDTLASFGGTDATKYLCFYMTNNTNKTTANVWLYWAGSQNAYTIHLPAVGETGWAYIDVTVSGHTTTEITDFAFGFNNWASDPYSGSVTIEKIILSDTMPA